MNTWSMLGLLIGAYFMNEFFGPAIEDCAVETYHYLRRYISEKSNMWKDVKNRNVKYYSHFMEKGKLRFKVKTIPGRAFSQMVLPDEINNITRCITAVIDSERSFSERYSLLLKGPPGTGKTGFVTALATELNMPVYSLTLSSVFLGEESVKNRIFSSFQDRSIVCIEDADSTFTTDLVQKGRINLDTLLNGIDGPTVSRKLIYIMTCNDHTVLPKKLKRRFNHVIEFGLPTPNDAGKLHDLYFSNYNQRNIDIFIETLNRVNGDEPFVSFADLEGCYKRILYTPVSEHHSNFIMELAKLQRY